MIDKQIEEIIIDQSTLDDIKKLNQPISLQTYIDQAVKCMQWNIINETIEQHTVIGNIFDCKENIICHQVNMQKKMGSGIAKQIRDRYPNVYNDYLKHEPVLGDIYIVPVNHKNELWIANMYSQNRYGYDGNQYTDYDAMRKCFNSLNNHLSKSNKCGNNLSLAIPYKIGCGLGGGDWSIVSKIIVQQLKDIIFK